jgi:uncharacterized protein YukE
MTVYTTAESAIGGNPEQLGTAAATLAGAAEQAGVLETSLTDRARSTEDYWQGPAAKAYRTRVGRQAATLKALPDALGTAAAAYLTLSAELAEAQRRAGAAMRASVALGLGEGDLVGRPFNVTMFALTHPGAIDDIAGLIGQVVGARAQANGARDRFVAAMGDLRGDVSAAGGDDRRNPDERDGRRIRSDEIFRRSEGGDRGGDHFSNDWAGRAILERYLRGGDDWTITDDEDWSNYMMDNQRLREQLTGPAQDQAQVALHDYLNGRGSTGSFDEQFAAEIENGEGIVGYQYLHGTSEEAGGFEYQGTSAVRPRADGNYEVTLDSGYTWNDTIDPNPQYTTDTWKSRLAEVVTLGQADPYDIHLTWHSETTVVLDQQGNVIEIEGYPAP